MWKFFRIMRDGTEEFGGLFCRSFSNFPVEVQGTLLQEFGELSALTQIRQSITIRKVLL